LYPIEIITATVPGVVDSDAARPLYRFYKAMNFRSEEKCASVDLPTVGLTEHVESRKKRYLTVINFEPFVQKAFVSLKDGWHVTGCVSPDGAAQVEGKTIEIAHNSGAVLTIECE